MANLHASIKYKRYKIIKTYYPDNPEFLLEEVVKYHAILKGSLFCFPETNVHIEEDKLLIEQENIKGLQLNSWLTEKYQIDVACDYFNILVNSIGEVKEVGTHYISGNNFCIDGSFSNIIIQEITNKIYYIDSYPPLLIENYVKKNIIWSDLGIDPVTKNPMPEKFRYMFFDARGMLLDALIHLIYYLALIHKEGDLIAIVKYSLDRYPSINGVLSDMYADEISKKLLLEYLRHKNVAAEIDASSRAIWEQLKQI